MTSSAASVVVVIAEDDPAEPMLSLAFAQARDRGAAVNALQCWSGTPDRALADRERWLFNRLAFYQEQYPDLYATAEPIGDPAQLASRSRSAVVTIVGQRWLSRHRQWQRQRQQGGRRTAALTVVSSDAQALNAEQTATQP
jgi:hypothetical protein